MNPAPSPFRLRVLGVIIWPAWPNRAGLKNRLRHKWNKRYECASAATGGSGTNGFRQQSLLFRLDNRRKERRQGIFTSFYQPTGHIRVYHTLTSRHRTEPSLWETSSPNHPGQLGSLQIKLTCSSSSSYLDSGNFLLACVVAGEFLGRPSFGDRRSWKNKQPKKLRGLHDWKPGGHSLDTGEFEKKYCLVPGGLVYSHHRSYV